MIHDNNNNNNDSKEEGEKSNADDNLRADCDDSNETKDEKRKQTLEYIVDLPSNPNTNDSNETNGKEAKAQSSARTLNNIAEKTTGSRESTNIIAMENSVTNKILSTSSIRQSPSSSSRRVGSLRTESQPGAYRLSSLNHSNDDEITSSINVQDDEERGTAQSPNQTYTVEARLVVEEDQRNLSTSDRERMKEEIRRDIMRETVVGEVVVDSKAASKKSFCRRRRTLLFFCCAVIVVGLVSGVVAFFVSSNNAEGTQNPSPMPTFIRNSTPSPSSLPPLLSSDLPTINAEGTRNPSSMPTFLRNPKPPPSSLPSLLPSNLPTLNIKEVQRPDNDVCASASPIPLGLGFDFYLERATADSELPICDDSNNDSSLPYGIWYTVTGGTSGAVLLSLTSYDGADLTANMVVYSGTCGTLSCLENTSLQSASCDADKCTEEICVPTLNEETHYVFVKSSVSLDSFPNRHRIIATAATMNGNSGRCREVNK